MRAPMRIFIFVYRHCLFKKESKYDPTGQLMDRILNALCIACEPKTQANATDSLPDKPKISAQLGYIHDTDCKEGAFVEMVDLKTNPDHSLLFNYSVKKAIFEQAGYTNQLFPVDLVSPFKDDSECFDEINQILMATTVRTLASVTAVPEVLLSTTITDILRMMEKDGTSCILVRDFDSGGATRDAVFRRIDVFRTAMSLRCTARPLAHIAGRLPPVLQLDGGASLEEASQAMQAAGCEEVAVVDGEAGDVVRGVVTCKGLLAFLRHQQEGARAEPARGGGLARLGSGGGC